MAVTAFHHLALITTHLDATLKLYQEGMGLKLWHVWGRAGKDYILDLGDDSYLEIMEETHDEPVPASCWQRLNLRTDNIRRSVDSAVAAGAVLKEDVHLISYEAAMPSPYSYYAATVIGAEGEEIGFVQEIGQETEYACKVHSVVLRVTDLSRTVRVYQESFGFFAGPVNEEKQTCTLDLRGGVTLQLVREDYQAPLPRGLFAHIAFKDMNIHRRYQWAGEHGMRLNFPPVLCDVSEATPFPVQFWSAGTSGPDGEDVTLSQDVII